MREFMNGFVRRGKVVGLACVLAAGLGVAAMAATATPAFAANGPCYDITNAQPTPLHYTWNKNSQTVKFLNAGSTVTGTCAYVNNVNENHWYMQVNYIGPDNNGGYGYIWVQRLDYGSGHNCKYQSGATFAIGSSYCPLYYSS